MRTDIFAIAALLIAGNLAAQSEFSPGHELEVGNAGRPATLSTSWLERADSDFSARRLLDDTAAVPDSRHAENAPVQFAWALEDLSAGSQSVQTARVESRQYWVDATGAELAGGVSLPLTARGAVIRVSPLESDGDVGIDPANVQLAINGKRFDSTTSMMRVTDGVSLQKQGMSVPPQTIAFKLDEAIPAGKLELAVARLPEQQDLVVHVFEPESAWVAELELPRHNFVAGEQLAFGFALGEAGETVQVDSVQAVLADPYAQQTWDLEIDRASGKLTRSAPGESFVSGLDGLFEAYVYLETEQDGLTVRRDLKLPVSIVPPLARLNGQAQATLDDGLRLQFGVETAAPGRYQVNGQVFGTAADGSLQPLAMAQAATVIDGRFGNIELKVGNDLLESSGLGAPFEVRNLELLDQGRMFVLQRQQRALLLAE